MLVAARKFELIVPQVIVYPSSSWFIARREAGGMGVGAYLQFTDPSKVAAGDIVAGGTACSSFTGMVEEVEHHTDTDDEEAYSILTCQPLPLEEPLAKRWWHIDKLSMEAGERAYNIRWGGERYGYCCSETLEPSSQGAKIIGEAAVAAWPGGDVHVDHLEGACFIGRSGRAETYEGYMALRADHREVCGS